MTNPCTKQVFFEKHKKILLSLLGIGVLVLVLVTPVFLNLVEFLGKRIPQENMKLDYIKGVLWAIFLGATILLWPVRAQDKKALLWIWLVKCLAMLGLMLFYEYHYPIDSFGFFSGARYDISEWKAMSLGGKSFPIVFMAWLHQHSFLDSFHAVKVSFGMIGLIGIYIFYRSVKVFLQKEKLWLLYFFAFFPSILFWSSIYGKEPIILLLIAIYCYGVIKWFRTDSFVYLLCALLGISLMSFLKEWMGPILILSLFISTVIFPMKNRYIKIAAIIVLFFASLLFVNLMVSHFNIKSSKDLIIQANVKSDNFGRGGSSLRHDKIEYIAISDKEKLARGDKIKTVNMLSMNEFDKHELRGMMDTGILKFNSLPEVMLYIPQGVFTVLFRPLPGEVNNVFGFLAGFESTFLLILFVLAMKRMRCRELFDPIVIWAILLIMFWAALNGFIGFNLGTVCRYRMQILPIFLGLLLYLVSSRDVSACHNNGNL